ncbi:MAG: FtsX-like permease family protein, partial [Bacteroidota bacterium]
RNRKDITYQQGLLVQERATLARFVGLEDWQYGRVVKAEGVETNPSVSLAGESPQGLPTNNWIVQEGRGLNQEDMDFARDVIVLGSRVVDKLFPYSDPIGEHVKIDGKRYRVIGYFEAQGGFQGGHQDNFAAIPISTFFNKYGKQNRSIHIMVQSTGRETYENAMEQVRGILRVARKVFPGEEGDFSIFSNESLIEQWNELTFYVKVGMAFVSSIALVAAGVGIMMIMLVSVTERTREIGIRRAVGAKKKDILTQFIMEAIVLCEVGGVVGVVLGILGGNIAALAFEFPAVVPYDWAMIGLGVCSLIGIIFGTYPAWKASNLDPIESLRYE